jgi:hypothetical protein
VVVHACSYSGSGVGGSQLGASPGKRPCLKNKPVTVYILVIPTAWEVELGGMRSEANLGKNVRPYL